MPYYKYTYFNARGRAESCRLLFAAAGVKYEDVRVAGEQWPQLKKTLPFGRMPVLEVDGEVLSESRAIGRYLARTFGLAGGTPLEQANVDMMVDAATDFLENMSTFAFEKDEAVKAEKMRRYKEEQLPPLLANFEEQLRKNNGGNSFLIGDKLTWADLHFLAMTDGPSLMFADEFAKWPLVTGLRARVQAVPGVADWLAKRPETPF